MYLYYTEFTLQCSCKFSLCRIIRINNSVGFEEGPLVFKIPNINEVAGALNAEVSGDANAHVTDVTHDSRQAREGMLFVAIRGATVDGHRFVDDVMRRGAAGIIS